MKRTRNPSSNPISHAVVAAIALPLLGAPTRAALVGHWAFDEGAGTTAADSSPGGNDGVILGDAVWGSDAIRENFLLFDGLDDSVDPSFTLPVMTDTNEFTWAFWANRDAGSTINEVVLGNRYNGSGTTDFAPRQFIKFTPTQFEWHQNGNGNDNLDYADFPPGEWHHHAVVKTGADLDYYRDGVLVQSSTLGEAVGVEAHPLFIGGNPGGPEGEHFVGGIDDVRVYDHALTGEEIGELLVGENFPPSLTGNPLLKPEATVGVAYSESLAGDAVDPNAGDVLTFSLESGPGWLTVEPGGAVGGTPTVADAGFNSFTIEVSDGDLSTIGTLIIRVIDPDAPGDAEMFGWWPLDDGSGNTARDISGNDLDAVIMNVDTGGLNDDGSAWVEDPECGTVLGFDGVDGTGAFAVVGAPPAFGTLPVFTLEDRFTWSLWAKSDQPADTRIVLGNRADSGGNDFVPREFIKFTSLSFEWDTNNVQGIDYEDLVEGVWTHLVIVKDGATLIHYRDGQQSGISTIEAVPANPQPLYFGGQGFENWRGYLSDVRLFRGALSGAEVADLFNSKGVSTTGAFEITDIEVDTGRNVTLTWLSRPNAEYALDFSTSLTATGEPGGWSEVDDGIESMGDSTTLTLPGDQFPFPASSAQMFFRIREF